MTADELNLIRDYKRAIAAAVRSHEAEREEIAAVHRDLERHIIARFAPGRRPLIRRRERCGTTRRRATRRATARAGDSGDADPPAAPARLLIGGAR